MSLTSGFIASAPAKPKKRLYSLLDNANFTSPRLQVTSLHENPNLAMLRNHFRGMGITTPIQGTHNLQWMTLSDGNYTISAILSPDLKHLVRSGQLKTNSIIELDGYVLQDNSDEAPKGRTTLVQVGAMTVVFSDFPGQMGTPKDIFDAASDGPRQYIHIPTNALLEVTAKCFEQINKGKARQVFTAAANRIRVQVTEISKISARNWHLALFDGWTYFNASLSTDVDLVSMGMTGLMTNNASAVMEGEEMLKVGDVISIPQYLIMGSEREGTKCMCLYNLSIYRHA